MTKPSGVEVDLVRFAREMVREFHPGQEGFQEIALSCGVLVPRDSASCAGAYFEDESAECACCEHYMMCREDVPFNCYELNPSLKGEEDDSSMGRASYVRRVP